MPGKTTKKKTGVAKSKSVAKKKEAVSNRAVAKKVTKKKTGNKKSAVSSLSITERVEQVLETLRPYLISDGGNIELLGVDEVNGIVTVHLVGACASCSSSQVTLYAGVEKALKEQIPQLNSLIAI